VAAFPIALLPAVLSVPATAGRRWAGRSRWFLAGALVAGLLAITGVVLVDPSADSGRGRPSAAAPTPPGPALSSSPPAWAGGSAAGAGGFTPHVCARQTTTGEFPQTPRHGARRTAPNGYALLSGWSYHRDAGGFGIAVPDGWTYQRVGTTVCFRDPDGVRVLSVDVGRSPVADPVRACRRESARLATERALPGYREVGIAPVPYFGRAADWEYRYRGLRGTALHANTRWFVAGDRAYAVGWVTREFDWRVNRANLDMIMSSFQSARA